MLLVALLLALNITSQGFTDLGVIIYLPYLELLSWLLILFPVQ